MNSIPDLKVLIGSIALLAGLYVTTSFTANKRSKKGTVITMGMRSVLSGRVAAAAVLMGLHMLTTVGVAASG